MGNGITLYLKNIVADFTDGYCIIEVSKYRDKIIQHSSESYFALCRTSEVQYSNAFDRYKTNKKNNYNNHLRNIIKHSHRIHPHGYLAVSPEENISYMYDALRYVPKGTFFGNGVTVTRYKGMDGWDIIHDEEMSFILHEIGVAILNFGNYTSDDSFGNAPKIVSINKLLNVVAIYYDSYYFTFHMLTDTSIDYIANEDMYINLSNERLRFIKFENKLEDMLCIMTDKLDFVSTCSDDILKQVELKVKEKCGLSIDDMCVYTCIRDSSFTLDLGDVNKFDFLKDYDVHRSLGMSAYSKFIEIMFNEIMANIPSYASNRMWIYELIKSIKADKFNNDINEVLVTNMITAYFMDFGSHRENNYLFLQRLLRTITFFKTLIFMERDSYVEYYKEMHRCLVLFIQRVVLYHLMEITATGEGKGYLCIKFIYDIPFTLKEVWQSDSVFRSSVSKELKNENIVFEVKEDRIDLLDMNNFYNTYLKDYILIGDFDYDNIALQLYIVRNGLTYMSRSVYDRDILKSVCDVYKFADAGKDLIFYPDRYNTYMTLLSDILPYKVYSDDIFVSFIYAYMRNIGSESKRTYNTGIWDEGVVKFIGTYYFFGEYLDDDIISKYKKYIISSVVLDFIDNETLEALCGSKQIYYDNFDIRKDNNGYYIVYEDKGK